MATVNLRVEGTLTHEDYWCDYWGDFGPSMSFDYFKSQYEWESAYAAEPVSDVRITIHSQGGLCDIAYQCYDFVTTQGKNVTTVIQGDCMSAATIIFLTGKTRLIPRHGKLMIHLPQGSATGDYRVFESYTQEMKEETQKLIDFYVRVTGQPVEVIDPLVHAATEISAERAVELGFATGILEPISARAFAPRPKNSATPPAQAETAPTATPTAAPVTAKPTLSPNPNKTRMSNKRGLLRTLIGAIVNLADGVETTAIAIKLADGRTLDVAAAGTDRAIGDAVEIDGATAADGDYTTENGTVITVKDGVITAIVEATTDTGTTEDPTNQAPPADPPAPGTEGTTTAPTNSGSTDNRDATITQLRNELAQEKKEREALEGRMNQISNRMTHFGKLMGEEESAPVTTPNGSGATPSQQRSNKGGGGEESIDDTMKSIAGKYAKPERTRK